MMAAMRREEERRYEERECRWCHRRMLHADSFSARPVPCTECGGTGRVTVYLYPPRRGSGGRS